MCDSPQCTDISLERTFSEIHSPHARGFQPGDVPYEYVLPLSGGVHDGFVACLQALRRLLSDTCFTYLKVKVFDKPTNKESFLFLELFGNRHRM